MPKVRHISFFTLFALTLIFLTPYSYAGGYWEGDGSVSSTVEINSGTANGPELIDGDYYGYSVANIGDLDGDGVNDLAVGAAKDDEGGSARGAVHIHFMTMDHHRDDR